MAQILLIEPNTLLATTYRLALEHVGHMVAHATSAQAAITAADFARPDLVIVELQLPEHSGLEFLHEFRSYSDWQTVPVVVHTHLPSSRVGFAEAALARDLGVSTVLYKPRTSLEELLRVVQGQLTTA